MAVQGSMRSPMKTAFQRFEFPRLQKGEPPYPVIVVLLLTHFSANVRLFGLR